MARTRGGGTGGGGKRAVTISQSSNRDEGDEATSNRDGGDEANECLPTSPELRGVDEANECLPTSPGMRGGGTSNQGGDEANRGGDEVYESLQQHGYKAVGLPDIPAPEEKPDWAWATGKDKQRPEEVKESYREREATRAAVENGKTIENAQLRTDKKSLSFSQKEKKKRDLGQASRGKNYVEEEKRQLRESGVYSGFDS